MATVALEPASGRTHAELAALFTSGYEGYFMPVAVDESAFSFMAGTWDYDLDASLIADNVVELGAEKVAANAERR